MLELNDWVADCGLTLDFKIIERGVGKIILPFPARLSRSPFTPQEAAKSYGPLVCMIKSAIGTGSGALVSGDGLILSCAHVLSGPKAKVVFSEGALKGEYNATVLYVNEKDDVSLIKAHGVRSGSWIPIRFSSGTKKGEKIIAIGNPIIRTGTGHRPINVGGITQGIVSNVAKKINKTDRIIADISVASGSSGGPLISLNTREIVGVVTDIYKPGIGAGPDSSGFVCLAAPSQYLSRWLGIVYQR
jgi:S1-C subfamily serine protease